MAGYATSRSILQGCVLLVCLIAVHAAPRGNCNKAACPGPLRYYKELGCKPVFENPKDCCATAYDCSHLKNLSKDKCYAGNNEYKVGERLKPEDKNACDLNCECTDVDGVALFYCDPLDCEYKEPNATCYNKGAANKCCAELVCHEEGEKIPTCLVDGKTYLDGEYFKPKSQPDLDCYCVPGHEGEFVEPYCTKPKRPSCSPLFQNHDSVHKNCAPVFRADVNPQKDCTGIYRCQNANDVVIHSDSDKSVSTEENKMCKFGDMFMHVGDELKQGTYYDSVCVKCVCDVPPVPTCRVLPDTECDVTDHPPFA